MKVPDHVRTFPELIRWIADTFHDGVLVRIGRLAALRDGDARPPRSANDRALPASPEHLHEAARALDAAHTSGVALFRHRGESGTA